MSRDAEWDCLDCGKSTLESSEYYMLRNELWEKMLGPKRWKLRIIDGLGIVREPVPDGMLCITCVEKRLGRRLHPWDFLECPLNEMCAWTGHSVLLHSRKHEGMACDQGA